MSKLQGWRAVGAALVAGALAALAMPPLYWLPLARGHRGFVWLWDAAATPISAFGRGLAWGTGHFAVGSYWMLEAFFVPPADFALLGPPMVLGLAAVLEIFPGLAATASRRTVDRWPVPRRPLPSPGAAGDRLDGCRVVARAPLHRLSLESVSACPGLCAPLLQGAALFGVYGLGIFIFLVLAAPMAGWRATIVAFAVAGLAGFAGQTTMAATTAETARARCWIRIVQPNVPQSRNGGRKPASNVGKLVAISRQAGFERLAAVIWPETAPP